MVDYTLISVPPGAQREAYLPLLLLADESLEQVRSYMNRGELYAFVGEGARAVGIALTIPTEENSVELKAVAVDGAPQNRGIGRRMLAAVLERDFFSPVRGYPAVMEDNGIRLRDMVWMDLELQAASPTSPCTSR